MLIHVSELPLKPVTNRCFVTNSACDGTAPLTAILSEQDPLMWIRKAWSSNRGRDAPSKHRSHYCDDACRRNCSHVLQQKPRRKFHGTSNLFANQRPPARCTGRSGLARRRRQLGDAGQGLCVDPLLRAESSHSGERQESL